MEYMQDFITPSLRAIKINFKNKKTKKETLGMEKEKAKQLGVKKLYVSAFSSKNTVDFYRGSGFHLTNPVKEFFEDEPNDIHMDMKL